jgi:RsiW-degrading membrane proteinase PrsW (M82 family)
MSTFSIGICALLAAVPAIIWSAIFLKRRDKNFKTYIWVFLGGTLTVLPILGYQYVYLALIGDNPDLDFVNKLKGIITGNYWIVLLYAFVGITEEIVKFYIVKILDKRHPEIITTINDALKMGILSALGFAFSENIIYFVRILNSMGTEGLIAPFIFRSVFTVCAHLIFSGIFAYYYGVSKFSKDFVDFKKWQGQKVSILDYASHRRKYIGIGLALSLGLHAFFNTMLSISLPNNINILIVIFQVILMFLFLRHLLGQKTGNLTFILADKYKSTMESKDEDVVLELIGVWFKQKKYKQVYEICERLERRDPDNNVVKIFKSKAFDALQEEN